MTLSPGTSASLTPDTSRSTGSPTDTVVPPSVAGYSTWFDIADPAQLSFLHGSEISAIADQGSGATNATFPLSTPPVYGRPYNVLGDRLACYVIGSANAAGGANATASDRTQTAFVVGCASSLAGVMTLLGSNLTGGNQLRINATTGRLETLKENTASLFQSSASMAIVAGTPFIVAQILSDTTVEHRLYGVAPESTAEATTFTGARTLTLFANGQALTEVFYGWIGEVIIYPSTLAGGDVTAVLNGLAAKWGI